MLTSASVFSTGMSRSSGRAVEPLDERRRRSGAGRPLTWIGGVRGSRLFFGSDSLMRVLRSSSATRSPSIDTSTCSLMPYVAIVERP